MKQIKKFSTKSLLDSYLSGEVEYPLATLTDDDNTFRIITPPPVPTIYYTTIDGNQIRDSDTRVSSYIVSHTKESNGEYKIVWKDTMTSIPNSCFYYLSTLQTIRFENLDKVNSIGYNFVNYCSSLQSVDLSGLSNVTKIGYSFLQNCKSLQSVDLTPLSNITSIGSQFLYYCSGLQSIDLSPLSNVTSIGNESIRGCTSLVTLTMPDTTSIQSIGTSFLYNCSNLTTIYCPKGTLDLYKSLMPSYVSIMVEMD